MTREAPFLLRQTGTPPRAEYRKTAGADRNFSGELLAENRRIMYDQKWLRGIFAGDALPEGRRISAQDKRKAE